MKTHILEARLDVLEAAVLALAASLPPEWTDFARRMFSAAIADMEDESERDSAADVAAASLVAAVLAALGRASVDLLGSLDLGRCSFCVIRQGKLHKTREGTGTIRGAKPAIRPDESMTWEHPGIGRNASNQH